MASVADIIVSVGADVSPLRRGLNQGSGYVRGFESDAANMGKKLAAIGAASVAALAAAGAGALKMAKDAASAGAEIERQARIANASAEEFQKFAAAASAVGIEQDKLADILKDVNDRVGDFLTTGAGPMADFFEQIAPRVGVTAEQFAKLSGPEALQLYVSSLQKAGVNQQQFTFFMEAMASDATALLPLLRNNGQALQELGDKAAASGRIMSNETVAAASALDRKFSEMGQTVRDELNRAMNENADVFLAAATSINESWIPAIGDGVSAVAGFIADVIELTMKMSEAIAAGRSASSAGRNSNRRKDRDQEGSEGPGQTEGSPLSLTYNRRAGVTVTRDADWLLPPEETRTTAAPEPDPLPSELPVSDAPSDQSLGYLPPVASSGGGSGGSGGSGSGGSSLGRGDFADFQTRLMTEAELLQEHRDSQLEKLQEFREKELATEAEYGEAKTRILAEFAEKSAALEDQKNRERVAGMSSALGDLSSLMASENKKMFAMGKAAAMAEAAISGGQAAVDAWKWGMKLGGPAMAAGFAAASLAKTGMMISQIQSQEIGSASGISGGGGGASYGGAASSGASAASGSGAAAPHYDMHFSGGSFSEEDVKAIAIKLQELSRQGATWDVR